MRKAATSFPFRATPVCLLLLFLLLPASFAHAQWLDLTAEEKAFARDHPVVTYSDVDWEPLSFVRNGRNTGLFPDYYDLVGKLTGIEFRFQPVGDGLDFQQVLDALRDKRIDMIDGTGKTAAREKYALFSGPFLTFPLAIVSRMDNLIGSMNALEGKTVLVAKGSTASDFLREKYPDISLAYVEDPREALRMVDEGKADAMLDNLAVVSYAIAHLGLHNLRVSGQADYVFDVYSLVRDDWAPLASILNKAHAAIPRNDIRKLRDRWLPADALPEEIRERTFSADEEFFLKAHPVITAANEKNWPPFNFNENGIPLGYSIDLLGILSKKLGIRINYITGPNWDRFESMLKNQRLDILPNTAMTPERKAYADFTQPYAVLMWGLAFRDTGAGAPTLDSLSGRTLAVTKGYYAEQMMRTHYPDIKLVPFKGILECLQAVSAGKADAAIDLLPSENYLIRKHFITNVQTRALVGTKHFLPVDLRFAVSKDQPLLRSILDKALSNLPDSQLEELGSKWLSAAEGEKRYVSLNQEESALLSRMEEVAMCVDPDWLPLSGIDEQGRYIGMTADYTKLMAARLGVPFRLVPTKTWPQTLEYALQGKCEIVQAITPTESRKDFLDFTRPYLEFPLVVAALQDTMFIQDIAALSGKRVGALAGSAWAESLRAEHPEVELVEVDDIDQGLRMVQEGKIFGYIDTMPTISYYIGQHGLTDVKIAGKLKGTLPIAVGVRKGDPRLERIIQKAVDSVTEEEKREIFNRWITVAYRQKFNYALLWRILAGVAVVLAVIFFWNRKLARLNREIQNANDRLHQAHAKMAALLDNSGQGFLSFARDGLVEPELSRECERIFAREAAGVSIASLLHPDDPLARDAFAKNVRRILDEGDEFKRGLYLSLMPREFALEGKQVEADYKVLEGGRLMLVLTDVTSERLLEEEVKKERDRLELIVAAVRDQEDFFQVLDGFTAFIRARLKAEPSDGDNACWDLATLYRQVHTYKGLFLQLEFIHTPDALHRIETTLSAWRDRGEEASPAKLEEAWEACGCEWALATDLQIIRTALGDAFFSLRDQVRISVELAAKLERLAAKIEAKASELGLDRDDAALLGELHRLRLRDLRLLLGAYPKAARALAGRMGKSIEPFEVEGDEVPVDPALYSPLVAALVHVFRNAVVHGIEDVEQRLAAGKPEAGRISCRVRDLGESVELEVSDDGRGVDMEALAARAAELGLEVSGDPDKDLDLIFNRDLSTQETADSLSGRGVGLFAVKEKLTRLGGACRVASIPGKGTTFTFTLPKPQTGPEAQRP